MAEQLKFPNPQTQIAVAEGRAEPAIWVRRLVIWSEPRQVLRDISLRRGLNIIWSPDPGEAAGTPGMEAETGHGAGKTLFCRLLRYCLGEETFGTDNLRNKLSARFPEGHVGAEVMVGGRQWSVVRPLGRRRRHLAAEGTVLQDLVIGEDSGTGTESFVQAVSDIVLSPVSELKLPNSPDPIQWLHLLAWLTRDQECRLEHIFSWRNTRAESRSPALGLPRDAVRFVARSTLGLMTNEEAAEETHSARLNMEKARTEEKQNHLNFLRDRLVGELCSRLALSSDAITPDSMGVQALRAEARQRREQDAREQPPEPSTKDLDALREQLLEAQRELAVLEDNKKREQATRDLHTEQIRSLRGERSQLDADEVKARLGDTCPVCLVPIDKALAEGCPLSSQNPDPEEVATQKNAVEANVRRIENLIKQHEKQIYELDTIIGQRKETENKIRQQVNAEEARIDILRKEAWKKQAEEERIESDIDRLDGVLKELSECGDTLNRIEKDLQRSRETQANIRKQHSQRATRFSELFDYVVQGLMGTKASGQVEFSGRDVLTKIDLGGERETAATDSLKAIAFDIAAMISSMEGQAFIPPFFVHDSPREADIGLSVYHRLFRFIHELEALNGEPAFQYLLTTTTQPPAELASSPYLALELHGLPAENRLMRADL